MANKDLVTLTFKKSGHFWLDSGLLGLIQMLKKVDTGASIEVSGNSLLIEGTTQSVQVALENAYGNLITGYYNLSTKKQRENLSSFNFYYDSKEDRFISFPKRKSTGIAEIIYNKAARPTGSSIKWAAKVKKEIKFEGKTIKKNRGTLPSSHNYLQQRMDEFLDLHGLDVTTSGLLVDGPNEVRPKVKIKIEKSNKKPKGNCYFCGEPSTVLEEANQTIFPLITGSSGVLSFNPMAGSPEKVCWKCSFLGKFVPVNGFYTTQGDHVFVFLPYSSALEKMVDVYAPLHDAEYQDPNLYRNFDHPLGGYYQLPFEVTFSFLYTLYNKLLKTQHNDEETTLDWEQLVDLTVSKALLEFYVMHAKKEGSTFGCKMVWPFKDSVYLYRLFHVIEQNGIDIKDAMRYLVDHNQKDESKTMARNRICERILKKQKIVDLVEQYVFKAGLSYFKPLYDLLMSYEAQIRMGEGNQMTKEEQETAVNLGRRVGTAVGKNSNGKKGDLFALRKARKKVDFLEQLNRLQFKLSPEFIVPADIYEGRLTDENFMEFKQFCMIAAVNSYNAAKALPKK